MNMKPDVQEVAWLHRLTLSFALIAACVSCCHAQPDLPKLSSLEEELVKGNPRPIVIERVVALVPDPLESNLELYFDRFVQSILDAATDSDFHLERYSYPWEQQSDKRDSPASPDNTHPSNKPGFLAFSANGRLLVVLLVRETPRSVNRNEFTLALQAASQEPHDVRILGPAFSGSAGSIADAVQSLPPTRRSIRFFSGSALNPPDIDLLTKAIRDVEVDSTNFADSVSIGAVADYLSRWFKPKKVVLLIEGQNQLSLLPDTLHSASFTFIAFPPSISISRKQQAEANTSRGATIRVIINETGQPPVLSETTPVSNVAQIELIGKIIREGNARYVGILSSNVENTISLVQHLRYQLPSVRFFTLDSDQLLVKAAESSALQGMLTFSLVPPGLYSGTRVFPSAQAFGVYTAMMKMLQRSSESSRQQRTLYASVVSRTGLWPVYQCIPKIDSVPLAVWTQRFPLTWIVVFLVMSSAALGLSAAVVRVNLRPWNPKQKLSPLNINFRSSSTQAVRLALLCGVTLALYIVMCFPLPAAFRMGYHLSRVFLCIAAFVILAQIVALRPIFRAARINRLQFSPVLAAAFLPSLIAGILCALLISSAGYPLIAYRSLELASGVSPLLPLVMLILGLFFGVLTFFRTVMTVRALRARLPELKGIGGVEAIKGIIDRSLSRGISIRHLAVVLLVAVLIAFDPWDLFLSIEPVAYEALSRLLVACLAALVLLNWLRVRELWNLLKHLLERLELHPIREAFDKFPQQTFLTLFSLPFAPPHFLDKQFLFETRAIEAGERVVDLSNGLYPDAKVNLDSARFRTEGFLSKITDIPPEDAIREVHEPLLYLADRLDEVTQRQNPDPPHRGEPLVSAAKEFVALFFVQYIHIILKELRNLLLFVVVGFVLLQITVNVYPWQGQIALNWLLGAASLILGGGILVVLAQMERDRILSRLAHTEPGKLGIQFWIKALTYGAGPILTQLSNQFPDIARVVQNWWQLSTKVIP
jgi:hypothetical protein